MELRPFLFIALDVRMPGYTVHPTTRLAVWLLMLVAIQGLSGVSLVVSVLILPLFGKPVLRRGMRLIWRTRWLLISLLAIFSWGVAGEPLWDGRFAPTHEGLQEAFLHLGRLVLVLMAVALFLEVMPLADVLAATHILLKPMRRFGLDPDRGVVRLMLVLRYVETLPRPRDWRTLLNAPASSVTELVEVDHQALRWSDYFITLLVAGAVLFFCFF
jgi:energy-coupling factor transporter transmembrane protein EcfT